MIEVTSGKLLLMGALGGSTLGLAALVAWRLGVDSSELDVVERYGVLGLLAVVIWLWNNSLVKNDARRDKHTSELIARIDAIVNTMGEMVHTNNKIKAALGAIVERLKEDRTVDNTERERAMEQVLAKVESGNREVLQQLGALASKIA